MLIAQRFYQVVDKYRTDGELAFCDGQRIYIPDKAYNAMVEKLQKADLPHARYEVWCAHGKGEHGCGILLSTLEDCGIDRERAEKIEEALMAIEPYTSKKPIEPFSIQKVLADVGDVWTAYQRSDNERRGI